MYRNVAQSVTVFTKANVAIQPSEEAEQWVGIGEGGGGRSAASMAGQCMSTHFQHWRGSAWTTHQQVTSMHSCITLRFSQRFSLLVCRFRRYTVRWFNQFAWLITMSRFLKPAYHTVFLWGLPSNSHSNDWVWGSKQIRYLVRLVIHGVNFFRRFYVYDKTSLEN